MPVLTFIRAALAFSIALCLEAGTARALAQDSDVASPAPIELYEQKIKAGLIYNLMKYSNWPATVTNAGKGKLKLCLLGDDSMDEYLYPLQGRTAQQFTITITRINGVHEIQDCNMIFLHKGQEALQDSLIQSTAGKPIMTVSDIDQFVEHGGMVEFGMEDQKINLLLNKKTVTESHIIIQSRLTKLAKLVSGSNG